MMGGETPIRLRVFDSDLTYACLLAEFSLPKDKYGEERLEDITKYLRGQSVKRLDVWKTFKAMERDVKGIVAGLSDEFPDVFATGTEKTRRLALAERYLRKHHGNMRHRARRQAASSLAANATRKRGLPPKKSTAAMPQNTATGSKHIAKKEIKGSPESENPNALGNNPGTPPPMDASDEGNGSVDAVESLLLPQNNYETPPSTPTALRVNPRPSSNTHHPSGFNTPKRPTIYPLVLTPDTPSSSTRTNATEISEVRSFLATCKPPMTHLLSRFIGFGCRNAMFLSVIAKYPEEKMNKLIDSVSQFDGDEREINGMEKMVLISRFLEYGEAEGN